MPPYVLRQWCLARSGGESIVLCGFMDRKRLVWKDVTVSRRIDSLTVEATSGSIYRLQGPLDKEKSAQLGIPEDVINTFCSGFPTRWKSIFNRKCRIPEQTASSALAETSSNHRMLLRSKTRTLAVSGNINQKANSSVLLGQLGVCDITRQPSSKSMVSTKRHVAVFPESSAAEVFPETKKCKTTVNRSASEGGNNSQPRTKDSRATAKSGPPSKPFPESGHSLSSTEKVITCPKKALPSVSKPRRKLLAKRCSTAVTRKTGTTSTKENSALARTSTPKKDVLQPGNLFPVSGHSLSSTERVTPSPKKALPCVSKPRCKLLAKRRSTAVTRKTTKENSAPAIPKVLASAGKGTMKRRRQLKQLMEEVNKGHEDNLLDSTPFRNRKPWFEATTSFLDRTSTPKTPPGVTFRTPPLFNANYSFVVPKFRGSSREDSFMKLLPPCNDERYMHHKKKWHKKEVKPSQDKTQDSDSTKQRAAELTKLDSQELLALLQANLPTKCQEEKEDDEDRDYYFEFD